MVIGKLQLIHQRWPQRSYRASDLVYYRKTNPRQTAEENCLPQDLDRDLDHHDYKDWKPSLPHVGLHRS